jgi:hypothetical protein
MNTSHLSLVLANTLLSLALIEINPAQAATVVSNTFNSATPDNNSIPLCPVFFSDCTPNGVGIGQANQLVSDFVVVNNSNFIINKFVVTILNLDATWGTVSSDIFSQVDLSADGIVYTLSGGSIEPGKAFLSRTLPNDTSIVTISVRFEGTQVPESNSLAGLGILSVLGMMSLWKKRSQS